MSEWLREGRIDGKALAARVRAEVAVQVERLRDAGVHPGLALVRVGDDPASGVYVAGKARACTQVGLHSEIHQLDADISERELLERLVALQRREGIDGVLVQLPLPRHLDERRILAAVEPARDVDGFHPANLGELFCGMSLLEPCTPRGIMVMLAALGEDLRGKEAVVVGRSRIVGRPMAQLLMRESATVVVCHRHTADLESHVRRADLLVVATGVPGLVPGDWVKPGALVFDVGINRLDDGSLVGDVDTASALVHARGITPVPGGVGPMTVAMLLWNTVLAAWARRAPGLTRPELPFAPCPSGTA